MSVPLFPSLGNGCWLLAASLCLFHPSTSKHFFLPQGALNMVRILFCIVCLNLIIPSAMKHLFLQSVFYRARILLVIIGLPLPISFTRNLLFLLYSVFNRARLMLSIAGLHGYSVNVGYCLPSTDYSINQEPFVSMAPRSYWL